MLRAVVAMVVTTVVLAAQQLPPLLVDHVEPSSGAAREHTDHARLCGRIVDGAGAAVAGAKVFVYGHQPFFDALPLAAAVTDAKGEYACEVTGRGRTRLFVVSPPDRAFAIADASLTLCSGAAATRDAKLVIPAGEAPSPMEVHGRLLASDGKPVAGAFVRLQHERAFDPAAFTRTTSDGAFTISTRLGVPQSAVVFVGGRRRDIGHVAGQEKPEGSDRSWTADLTRELVLTLDRCELVAPKAAGAENVTFASWLGGVAESRADGRVIAWREDGLQMPASASVLVNAPGHLPRYGSAPQDEFDFSKDDERSLRVVDDAGAPVVGAIVDVCLEGQRFEEHTMTTVRTDDEGRVRLRGAADARHVVYAYGPDHDPARGVWLSGSELRLVLAQRSGALDLEVTDEVASVYVRHAGVFDPAAIVYPTAGKLHVPLAPGAYEVTCYGKSKPVVVAVRARVVAGKATAVPLRGDERPTVRVRVPAALAGDGKWWAYASRDTWGGMITKFSIYTDRGGPMPRRALVAEVEELANAPGADREFLLRMPISGRTTIALGAADESRRWFRECALEFGAKDGYVIELPAGSVALRAEVAKYPESWGMGGAFHGVVGPRLCLEPQGGSAFGLFVPLPEPAKFTVNVPAPGRYVVHHHLYETGILWSTEGTWGGRDVEVGDAAIDLGSLARGPDATLEVRVTGANGASLTGTLAVRDRMFEAWSSDLAQNTTLDDSSDPIPTPPSARLENGVAKLDRVRAGRLQFTLDLDDGRRVFFTRDVDPTRRLDVELPSVAP